MTEGPRRREGCLEVLGEAPVAADPGVEVLTARRGDETAKPT